MMLFLVVSLGGFGIIEIKDWIFFMDIAHTM